MAEFTPLKTDFKDDILAGTNAKRKYQQTFNTDGSVSLDDVTQYQQQGDEFSAAEFNKTNKAINKIYSDRIVNLDELDLVTETGFFVDALVVKELLSDSIKQIGDGYIKYKNGILQQWGRADSPSSGAGGQGYATVDFPQPFIDTSYIATVSPEYNSNYPAFGVSIQRPSASKMYVYTRQLTTGGLLMGVHVSWMAIGRWM